MAKRYPMIEDVLKEIQRLESSDLVALARKSEEVECACRQYMAELQRLEEKGKDLAAAGISVVQLEAIADCMYAE